MDQHLRGSTPFQVAMICCGYIWPLEGDIMFKTISQICQKCGHFFEFTPIIPIIDSVTFKH